MRAKEKAKITKRQLEIVTLMYSGFIMIIGQSETTGRPYYMITKGYDNIYFNASTFSRLLSNGLIYQQYQWPQDYVLTEFGEICAKEIIEKLKQKTNAT